MNCTSAHAPTTSESTESRAVGCAPSGKRSAAIALINMPFAPVGQTSLQCGLLKAILRDAGHRADVYYLNLQLANMISPKLYAQFAEERWVNLLTDWLFAAVAFGPSANDSLYLDVMAADSLARLGLSADELLDLRCRRLPEAINTWASETDWSAYAAVGFSCTFDQVVASFAMARRLKEAVPGLTTIFGGAQFNSDNAAEYLRKLPWVDCIVVGDGDRALPAIADCLAHGQSFDGIGGVIARNQSQTTGIVPEIFENLDALPDPDYSEYFDTLDALGRTNVIGTSEPTLVFQSARGCWWGEKHKCTFCGLPKDGIRYRSKTPDLVYAQLERLARRYRALEFSAADAILDMRYINTLFASIRDSRQDYRLFYETKANLTRPHVRALVQGGAKHIQAGIESLSTNCLRLMNKGTTMLLNLRLLKWARYYHLRVSWNLLLGFTGESADDYRSQSSVVRLIPHLQPPSTCGSIQIEKCGNYFDGSDPMYQNIRPLEGYSWVFPADIDIPKVAVYFDCDRNFDTDPNYRMAFEDLQLNVETWKHLWQESVLPSLIYERAAEWIQIHDRRDPKCAKTLWLEGPRAAAYHFCSDTAQSVRSATSYVRNVIDPSVGDDDVCKMLEEMTADGLMVAENGCFLSLALPLRRTWAIY
jgi:ribosomal peptide maturation radical SAM protein 1